VAFARINIVRDQYREMGIAAILTQKTERVPNSEMGVAFVWPRESGETCGQSTCAGWPVFDRRSEDPGGLPGVIGPYPLS
jgi:hypothetical protein